MKTRELIHEIKKTAGRLGVSFALLRQGGNHEIWLLGGTRVEIPRHREIGPKMAYEIRKQCESELGKDWWR